MRARRGAVGDKWRPAKRRRALVVGVLVLLVLVVWTCVGDWEKGLEQWRTWHARNVPRKNIAVPASCGDIPVLANLSLQVSTSTNHRIPQKAAVVYLLLTAGAGDRKRNFLSELESSIASVSKFLQTPEFTQILLFVDDPNLVLERERFAKLSRLPVQVIFIDDAFFTLPHSGLADPRFFVRCSPQGVGYPPVFSSMYLKMNVFRVRGIWKHPIIASFDYLLFVDSDVQFIGDFPLDFIQTMGSAAHSHFMIVDDPEECVPSLELLQFYLECTGVTPFRQLDKDNIRSVFVGALQLLKRDFFQSQQFSSFVAYLDRLGGIYSRRWADHNIYWLALQIFGGKSKAMAWNEWTHKGELM